MQWLRLASRQGVSLMSLSPSPFLEACCMRYEAFDVFFCFMLTVKLYLIVCAMFDRCVSVAQYSTPPRLARSLFFASQLATQSVAGLGWGLVGSCRLHLTIEMNDAKQHYHLHSAASPRRWLTRCYASRTHAHTAGATQRWLTWCYASRTHAHTAGATQRFPIISG